MIRYFEYLYLLVAVGLVGFMAFNFEDMSTGNIVVMMIGIVLSSFMYSFRRKQRMVMEEAERKRIQELEDEVNEDGA